MDERWEVQYTYPGWFVWTRFPAKYVSEEVARLAIRYVLRPLRGLRPKPRFRVDRVRPGSRDPLWRSEEDVYR